MMIQEVLESWQIKMDKSLKEYTTFTVDNCGFFKCDNMPFGLYKTPAMFQRLMQNCLRDLNLTYCLIYLDDIVIFSQTAGEHLHHLHVVFGQFREHTLKLKPSKCNLSLEKKSPIWYIESQRMGCKPLIQNWKQLQNACHYKLA